MSEDAKLNKFLGAAAAVGIDDALAMPPLYKLVRKAGIDVAPPAFQESWKVVAMTAASFAIASFASWSLFYAVARALSVRPEILAGELVGLLLLEALVRGRNPARRLSAFVKFLRGSLLAGTIMLTFSQWYALPASVPWAIILAVAVACGCTAAYFHRRLATRLDLGTWATYPSI